MRSFPEAACYLRLTLLDLTDNDLNALPPALGRMTTLRALPLSGNPIRGLRINQPVSGLLKSLRNRLEEEVSTHNNLTNILINLDSQILPAGNMLA